jgi:uncharacterized membrane protein
MVKTISYEELNISIMIAIIYLYDKLDNGAEMPYYLMN